VTRAVRSVLCQTLKDLEVIVVLDGADPATLEALAKIDDDRLRPQVRAIPGGQPAAVNSGIALVRAPWTAILDDDDEWMPEKLETQLACARGCKQEPVVGCRFVARSEKGDACWPLRFPKPDERISEYLFCRTRLEFGEGLLPTSMFFAPTALFRAHPMNESMCKHCDLDWLIRVEAAGAKCVIADSREPLAVWNMQTQRDRLSNMHDWRFSRDWIASVRPLITDRAYAGFLLTWASASARVQADYSAAPFLLREAFRSGRPGLLELAVYGAVWALPIGFRASLSRAVAAISAS
jgi:glycosyltransferase involved in cell wall biosynthesis